MDKKAQQILFKTYWSGAGWKSKPTTTPEDFDYALKAGYMFEPVNLSHDDISNWVKNVIKKVDHKNVSKAFLSSLSSRRLDWRSALGSYAIARNFLQHKFSGNLICNICGEISISKQSKRLEDLNVLNFERLKWGGVRHLNLLYVAFDLEQFVKSNVAEPTSKDFEIFNAIIKTARSLNAEARPRELEKVLSKIIDSNKAERESLIQILGFCGILQPLKHKGFFESFVNYNEREERSVNKIDWCYPISWWCGADGVSETALAYFFQQILADDKM